MFVVVAAGIGIPAALGVFSGTSGGSTFTLTGTMTINDSSNGEYGVYDIVNNNGACEGSGPYSDLSSGTAVTVANSQGQTVATGALQAGSATSGNNDPELSDQCTMTFSVPNVPSGLSSYSITISHRGTQVVSAQEARLGVNLTIGS